MSRDDSERIKRLLDDDAAGASGESRDGDAARSAWMNDLDRRIDEFIRRMNQLKERIAATNDPTNQLDDLMSRLEKRARRLDRTAKRLLDGDNRPRNEQDDE
ncbi:MAG: hypothetical protein JXO72_15215 [Vicinamibacteria bacterium]|nr:hypothetical protein [Vicinamibacteria bacterium]